MVTHNLTTSLNALLANTQAAGKASLNIPLSKSTKGLIPDPSPTAVAYVEKNSLRYHEDKILKFLPVFKISNLRRHERVHAGDKKYECHLCHKKFSTASNLRQHMHVHDKGVSFLLIKRQIR